MIYIQLITEFLKVGTFAIGGYSTLALAIDEMLKMKWMDMNEISDMIAIAESTPGPIAVNLATYVGSMKAGLPGAIVATIAEIFPAFIIIILATYIMDMIIHNKKVEVAFSVIRPTMTGIILSMGLIFIIKNGFGIDNIYNIKNALNAKKEIILLIVLYALTIMYKKITKKDMGAIILILIAGACGILINMF